MQVLAQELQGNWFKLVHDEHKLSKSLLLCLPSQVSIILYFMASTSWLRQWFQTNNFHLTLLISSGAFEGPLRDEIGCSKILCLEWSGVDWVGNTHCRPSALNRPRTSMSGPNSLLKHCLFLVGFEPGILNVGGTLSTGPWRPIKCKRFPSHLFLGKNG